MSKSTESVRRGGVLAVHIGANVGYCFDDRPMVWLLPGRTDDRGYVGAALFDALHDFFRLSAPEKILLSDSLEEVETADVAALQVGLAMCIEVFACRRGIPVQLVHPKVVQTAIFDRADMSKKALRSAVTSLAKRRGLTNLDADAASALVLYEYATRLQAAA